MLTLTVRDPTGPEIFRKRYRELVRRVENEAPGLALANRPLWKPQERLRHVVAWELQLRDVWHLHALWGAPGAARIYREWVRKQWNRLSMPRGRLVEEEAHGIKWLVSRVNVVTYDRARDGAEARDARCAGYVPVVCAGFGRFPSEPGRR